MATIQERNGSIRVLFVYHGKRHSFTIGKVSQEEAATKASQVNYLLIRLRQRLITVPRGVDIVTFVENDGKLPEQEDTESPAEYEITLGQLRDRYIQTHANGVLEETTIDGMRLHFKPWWQRWEKGCPCEIWVFRICKVM